MVLHIFAHNFPNIQPIFNLQKVLESWDLGLSSHTLNCYLCRRCRKYLKITEGCNAYACQRCRKNIQVFAHNFLNIQPIFNPQKVLESWPYPQMLCILKHVGGVEGQNNLWHLRHRYYLMVSLESPKSQLSKTFCGLKIGWILRKLWVKTCVCSFDTFDMHRHYRPQLFWATFDTFDIQSITALIVHIELLSTPSTWVTVLCIEGPVCTFDTSDIHSL